MPLISEGAIIADPWTPLADEDAMPEADDVIVSFERLLDEQDALDRRNGRTGVLLDNAADPEELEHLLGALDLIALRFPAFTDGRAYSQARVLRLQLGYKGELRATGQVLADQAAFMLRCGFDTFEVDEDQRLEVWRRASRAITLSYQRGFRDTGVATRDMASEQQGAVPRRAAPIVEVVS